MMNSNRKCIICRAIRQPYFMYPFTQKTSIATAWCENIYPNDRSAAQELFQKVTRATGPTLCAEHFCLNSFDHEGNLRPNALPSFHYPRMNHSTRRRVEIVSTAEKINSNVMSILKKAEIELQKILPGKFIPREDTWDRLEKEQASGQTNLAPVNKRRSSHSIRKSQEVQQRAIVDPVKEEHNEPSTSFAPAVEAVIKIEEYPEPLKEEEDDFIDIVGEQEATTSAVPVVKPAVAPSSKRGRPRKLRPPELEKRPTRAASIEPAVTTRSGRQVKRKAMDYEEREQLPTTSRQSQRQPVSHKEAEILRNVVAATAGPTARPNQQHSRENARPNKLQVPKTRCALCKKNTERTWFGMMEHAREHSAHSLKCPFEGCDFSSDKRSQISYHTQKTHKHWAVAIDLCEKDPKIEIRIKSKMQECFPSSMDEVNEPGSVPCAICSQVVSPNYRSLYSHSCLHLPSRPYVCSECPTFEAYTEEEIEDHHKESKCKGDIVSNMDVAISLLVEQLFKSAFPAYAHLVTEKPNPADQESYDAEDPNNQKDGSNVVFAWESDIKAGQRSAQEIVMHDHSYCGLTVPSPQ